MKWFKKRYTWDGYWETCYMLKTFDPDEETDITFDDEESEAYTPSKAQINAVTFVINNQKDILNTFCVQFLKEYDKWKEIYEEHLPEMQTVNDVKKHICIGGIYVQTSEKEDMAYVGYSGGCSWDDEHGIGFFAHKLDVFEIGDSSIGFSGGWNAYRDLGIEKDIEKEMEERKRYPKMPKRYKPHSIYGLKPSQEEANKAYYYKLIEGAFNQEFIDHFVQGDINTETRTGYLKMSFLERACQVENMEIVDFLLANHPKDISGCLIQACRNLNKELIKRLMNLGADINEIDEGSKDAPIQHILFVIGSLERSQESKIEIDRALDLLKWTLDQGGNPEIILNPKGIYDGIEYLIENEELKQRIFELLKK